MDAWIVLDDVIIRHNEIKYIDISDVENLKILVGYDSTFAEVTGIQAIEFLMQVRPSVFEGRRFRWKRRVWAFHNLFGHPAMQIAALLGQYKLAMWIHDATVPRPIGKRGK